ncbi:MAG: SWIM zinc finger family protein, partial [Planctomycetia bacterium]|nr:SWIM zinc finger family protein [Planctomycetia bacterium]
YKIQIDIEALPKPQWRALKGESAGKMGTLVELLQGKLSKAMMGLVTGREHGLFPKPKEIKMRCSCPDGASMCKHLAAVLYGVGNRLDSSPELLFVLRGVDHLELIEQAIPTAAIGKSGTAPTIAIDDLGAIFDIEIGGAPVANAETPIPARTAVKQAGKKARTGKKVSATKAAATIPAKTVAKQAATKARAEKNASAPKKRKAKPVPNEV